MKPDNSNLDLNHAPKMGGGLPVVQYWAEKTLSPDGVKLWETLSHKSACLSCAWGSGGQRGGLSNEVGETMQRCMKSVEAIASELQPSVPQHFFEQYSIAELQELTSQQADRLGRLSFPVILRSGQSYYERVSWSEIYDLAVQGCQKPAQRVASYSSGRSSNEAAYLLQLMLRMLGSNHLANCSDLCHVASTVGLKDVFGSGTSMVSLESLKQADCVVLVGSNAPANHPRFLNELIQLRDRGGQVIVINPMQEVGLMRFASPAYPLTLFSGVEISSLYLQPILGSDVALFVAIQKALLENQQVDFAYLRQYTEGWEAVVEFAQNTDWDTLTSICGVSQAEIRAASHLIGTSQGVVFAWAMGITGNRRKAPGFRRGDISRATEQSKEAIRLAADP